MTAGERAALGQLAGDLDATLRWAVPLADYNTWHIGGPAEALLQPRNRSALLAAVDLARRSGWPWRLIGNGSNLLCPDAGLSGLTIHLANHLGAVEYQGDTVRAEAGAFLPRLAQEAARRGLAGLECVVGVPGTVGGACVMNAGIPSGTIGDVLVEVEVLDAAGAVRALPVAELELGHRSSRLQRENWLVLSALLQFTPDDPAAVKQRIAEHLAYRRQTQPLTLPSCGSVFRRPDLGGRTDLPPYPGALIEAVGGKGLRRGDAEVSTLHANWIVNLGQATAADVLWLMDELQQRVRRQFGVELVREVTVWSAE